MVYRKKKYSYLISTDRRKLKSAFICENLQAMYWGQDLSTEEIMNSVNNSRAYGLYHQNKQIGFAKVLSDYARFAYLSDVFIAEEYRGKGLSVFLLKGILEDPVLADVKKWMLATRDAHGLYKKVGFTKLLNPNSFMQLKKG
jgi:predicted GNAT family acetyltransferase